MSTMLLSYYITAMAAAGDYNFWKAFQNYGHFAPIMTFTLNILFFTALYEVAKEADDPLDDTSEDLEVYYSIIRQLKRDLFFRFKKSDTMASFRHMSAKEWESKKIALSMRTKYGGVKNIGPRPRA